MELAAGSSGLAGIVVGKICQASHVVITDGNETSSKCIIMYSQLLTAKV